MFICDSNLRILQVNEASSTLFKDNGGPVVGKLCHEMFAGGRGEDEKKNLEQALALRSDELLRTQRRLDELFDFPRELGTKAALHELVDFLIEFAVKLLPGSEPAFLLLDSSCEQLLRLEDCEPKSVRELLQILQKLEACGPWPGTGSSDQKAQSRGPHRSLRQIPHMFYSSVAFLKSIDIMQPTACPCRSS